jgi:hypothetical protein
MTSYRRSGLVVSDAIKDINNLRTYICNEFDYPFWSARSALCGRPTALTRTGHSLIAVLWAELLELASPRKPT